MTKRLSVAILIAFASICAAMGQESPSPIPTASLAPSLTPAESLSPSPSASSARSVQLSFVPPPLEGTISLGIYDENGKLVRVLHQEAELDEFTVGADALATQWDGKNDDGEDLPAGKYHARGYLVGHFKVDDLGQATASPVENNANGNVKVRLMPNPLANDERPMIALGIGFDDENSFLKTMDGLPLC